ncbi:MAG: rhomboid family intramembrane serine protease [Spirochaetes bacterium GWD1_27_9]|nr:MAG: rhomboid family intramembrane serine protease [Spirochaetes bacterium GWB1_27_13]OHD29216.1 MAG: rhomboid family intramembrane serine protease [Spirochaetes bacterium GWD1_27_9]
MIRNLKIALFFVLTMWIVFIVDIVIPIDFTIFGIIPRKMEGLIGILASPFLHGSIAHIIANTIPLFILLLLVLTFYKKNSVPVIIIIIILGGFLVWLFGRNAYHIGASGLIYGLAGFLFSSGIFRRDVKSILISIAIFLFYGGLIYGILPTQKGVSWEGHLFGVLVGVFCGYIFKKEKE